MQLFVRIKNLISNRRGATAVEYALIVGVIAAGLLVTVQDLRTRVVDAFANVRFN